MPDYLSPGVYVEEVPSAVKPIAGVSTSTACFIGMVPDIIQIPFENPEYDPTDKSDNAAPPYLTRQFPFRDLPPADSAEGKRFLDFKTAQAKLLPLAVTVPDADPKKPSTLLGLHQAMCKQKYRMLFSSNHNRKPGPKGPSAELVHAIVEMKQCNPRWGLSANR